MSARLTGSGKHYTLKYISVFDMNGSVLSKPKSDSWKSHIYGLFVIQEQLKNRVIILEGLQVLSSDNHI